MDVLLPKRKAAIVQDKLRKDERRFGEPVVVVFDYMEDPESTELFSLRSSHVYRTTVRAGGARHAVAEADQGIVISVDSPELCAMGTAIKRKLGGASHKGRFQTDREYKFIAVKTEEGSEESVQRRCGRLFHTLAMLIDKITKAKDVERGVGGLAADGALEGVRSALAALSPWRFMVLQVPPPDHYERTRDTGAGENVKFTTRLTEVDWRVINSGVLSSAAPRVASRYGRLGGCATAAVEGGEPTPAELLANLRWHLLSQVCVWASFAPKQQRRVRSECEQGK